MDERTAETAATLINVASFSNASPYRPLPRSTIALANLKHNPSLSRANPTRYHSPTTSTTTPPSCPTTLFSTIGIGMDGNATEAAAKAVHDALERAMQLNSLPRDQHYQIHVQLGVPSKQESRTNYPHPVHVDTSCLAQLLPPGIPLYQLVQVQLGGLLVPSQTKALPSDSVSRATCVVVACLTIHKVDSAEKANFLHQQQHHASAAVRSPTSVTNSPALAARPPATTSPVVQYLLPQATLLNASSALLFQGLRRHEALPHVPTSWEEVEQAQQHHSPHNFHLQQQQHQPRTTQLPVNAAKTTQKPSRTNSMEMLAHISAAMIGKHEQEQQKCPDATMNIAERDDDVDDDDDDEDKKKIRYNYKKLPPGKTPKHNKRLFVQHSYTDHSHEVPAQDELDLLGPTALSRTSSAAFPLKLHEILSQIESDGHDSIIGWLPHGRSFKIHKQAEFVDSILPMYFVMTKKSSFLRQLNLYGFNRLSGIGADQGSYYHENFLRGMKFLSRRMQRQKVNGNGIRAAGNPDEEPNLSRFPVCPPLQVVVKEQSKKTAKPKQPDLKQRIDHGTSNGTHKATALECSLVADALRRAGIGVKHVEQEVAVAKADPVPPDPVDLSVRSKIGFQSGFPLKLQRILDKLEAEGNTNILSWLPHGRAFIVHETDRFVREVLPQYFNQSKYSSFQRQCHMYHFTRITQGRDKGAYHHPNFQRGKPELSMTMQRTRVNGKGTRQPGNPDVEPDLYALPPLPAIEPGSIVEIPTDLPAIMHLNVGEGDDSGSTTEDEE